MKGTLKLAVCLDSLETERLAEELRQSRGHPIMLDASNVTFLGALSLQLLIAACRQWKDDSMAFKIMSPSEAFLDGLNLMGVVPSDVGLAETKEVTQ